MTYKLLLADDSVTIQRVIELTFADEDVAVTTVGDGQAAIDRLDTDPPDIVLADVDMPKRDGYDVASYVRNHPKLAHIPVVLLTGAFEPIDHVRAAEAGSSDVLAKPFEPQMVINRVKQLLGRKRDEGVAALPAQNFPPEAPPQAPPTLQSLRAPSAPRPPARSSMAMNDDHASLQNQPARPAPGQAAAQDPVSIDDYFDQLDAAFSSLQQPASPAVQSAARQADEVWIDSQPQHHQPAALEALMTSPPEPEAMIPDWPEDPPVAVAPPPPPPPPVPQPRPVPPAMVSRPAPAPAKPEPPAPAPVPVPPSRAAGHLPAEVSAAPVQVAIPPAAPAVPVITEEVIEEVVARVLERLSDRVVRETVTEIVSQTAERAVRGTVTEIVSETAERVVRGTVTEIVSETADRVVRETVTEIVPETAERLVLAEIDRIKADAQ